MANTWTTLLDAVYPVGSVYISYSTTSPATRFGGTWSAITGFPWLHDSTAVGTTGGEETHVLSVEEMPKHDHYCPCTVVYGGDAERYRNLYATNSKVWSEADPNNPVSSTGGSQSHNNLPPYYVLRGWRRTA